MKDFNIPIKSRINDNEMESRKFNKIIIEGQNINIDKSQESYETLSENLSIKELKNSLNNNVKCYLRIKPDSFQCINENLDNKKSNESFIILKKFRKDFKNEIEGSKNFKSYNTKSYNAFNGKNNKSSSKSKSKLKKYNSKSNLISL